MRLTSPSNHLNQATVQEYFGIGYTQATRRIMVNGFVELLDEYRVGYAVLRFKRFVCLLGGRMGSVTSYFQLSVMRLERGERLRRVGLVSRERSELTPFSVQTGVH